MSGQSFRTRGLPVEVVMATRPERDQPTARSGPDHREGVTPAVPARPVTIGAAPEPAPAPGFRPSTSSSADRAAGERPGAIGSPISSESADATEPADLEREGVDARRRGWFWHWNNIVTQYAPLLGLKGVGLLNSYTVWTDRRDASPHRGYAFPSQQAEADFYGEERSELITMNKILVALDLIEIRKEMIQRADERGRRWRVPHNLYRVKDRPDGMELRAEDVLRVAELARQDAAVYRYVRRIFSPRFQPIDRDNIWHAILAELAEHPTWRALQERTAALESRASARSRAGHKTRAAKQGAADDTGQTSAGLTDGQLRSEVFHDGEQRRSPEALSRTDVAATTTGLETAVAASNEASRHITPTVVAADNTARPGAVAPSNTTYHQGRTTTTTTTTFAASPSGSAAIDGACHRLGESPPEPERSAQRPGADEHRNGRAGRSGAREPAAGPAPDEVAASGESRLQRQVSRGEGLYGSDGSDGTTRAAGALAGVTPPGYRPATDLEDERDGVNARLHGAGTGIPAGVGSLADSYAGGPVGDPSPLVVSLFEAANARPSTPLERILLAELERDADPPARAVGASGADWVAAALREAVASGSAFVAPKRVREIITRWAGAGSWPGAPRPALLTPPDEPAPASSSLAPDLSPPIVDRHVRLPGGRSGRAIWEAVLADLARVLDPATFERLLAGSSVTRYWRGTLEVEVSSPAAAEKLSAEYRPLLERQLNERLPRAVAVRFHAVASPLVASAAPETPRQSTPVPEVVISHDDAELAQRIWRAIADELATVVPGSDLRQLAHVLPLGEDASGVMLLGAPTASALRLIDGRCRPEIEQALAGFLGRSVTVRGVASGRWAVRAT
jgi:hypothetical protein